MIRRIIDKRGKYYIPEPTDPTGSKFCRVMGKIAVKKSDVLKEVRCNLIPKETGYNGYIGTVNAFTYNGNEDRYEFSASITNNINIGDSYTYYMFIGMRLFVLEHDTIQYGRCTVYASSAYIDELYVLMRKTEDRGLIDSPGIISGLLWAVRNDPADPIVPTIEYEATWQGKTEVVDIPTNEYTTLSGSSFSAFSAEYKELNKGTGIEIRSKDNNVVIEHYTGIACVSTDSIYGPNFIEYKLCDDDSVVIFRIRIYINLESIDIESICTYDTSEFCTWMSPASGDGLTDYKKKGIYSRNGYYDAEDFTTGDQSAYRTPSELYIFRLNLSLEIPLLFADTKEYEIKEYHYRSYKNTGQGTAYVSWTDTDPGLTATQVSGYSEHFTLIDAFGTKLENIIDHVSIGDYIKLFDGAIESYGEVIGIDYDTNELVVTSETLIPGLIITWSIYEKYDMIKKIAWYAYSIIYALPNSMMVDLINQELEGIYLTSDYSYYGRNLLATIDFTPIDYSEKMYVPGLVGEEVLSAYSEHEEVYVSPGEMLIVSGEPFLALRGSSTHHGMVEVSESGTKVKFRFSNCVPYGDAEDVSNDTSNKFFLINSSVSDVYIENISILSKYIESIYLQNKESYERYLWVRDDDENIMYDIDIVQDDVTLTHVMTSISTDLWVVDSSLFPDHGTLLINGEVMTYSYNQLNHIWGITRGAKPRKHNIGDTVYCIKNLLVRKVLLGTIDNSIDYEETTISITENSGFVLPITMPYTDDSSGNTRLGIITIDDEMIVVDWSEYISGTFDYTGITRGAQGSDSISHPGYSNVYLYDYLNSGEIIRGSEYNNEYSGKYVPIISVDNKVDFTDIISTLKVYIVRIKWSM